MFFQLFISFFKIGLFTLGGGYAMLPLMHREIVEKHKLLDEDVFLDGITAAQSCPGAVAVNMSVYTGYHIQGWRGVVPAVLGTVIPSFVIILLIAMSFQEWAAHPAVRKVFYGLRPCVTALIAAPVLRLAKASGIKWQLYAIPLAAIPAIIFLKISPIILICLAILWGLVEYETSRRKSMEDK